MPVEPAQRRFVTLAALALFLLSHMIPARPALRQRLAATLEYNADLFDAATICRNLHGMRLAGFFDGARAVVVGRTTAPDQPTLTQHEAVLDALGKINPDVIEITPVAVRRSPPSQTSSERTYSR